MPEHSKLRQRKRESARARAPVKPEIAERRRADAELRETGEILRVTFQNAPIGMALASADDGRLIRVNDALCEMWGYTQDELLRKTWQDISHPQDIGPNADLRRRTLAGEMDFFQMEKRHIHKRGHVVWGQLSASLVRDADGNPDYFIAHVQDITDRKAREQEVGFKSSLVENARDAVFVFDRDGKMLYVNKAACEERGYTKDELMAMSFKDILMPEYARLLDSRIDALLESGTGRFESAQLRKDGSVVPVECHCYVMELDGRKAIVSLARDITERKRSKQLSDALNRISSVINSTLDFEKIMKSVIGDAGQAVAADMAGIALREGDAWVVRYVHGLPAETVGVRITDREARCQAACDRDTACSPNADCELTREVRKRLGSQSCLCVPLVVKADIVGLNFYCRTGTAAFSQMEIDFAHQLGVSVSLALGNARLYSEQRGIADTLQGALLTLPAEIPGIRYGQLYHSATETTRVGGDFYDAFEIEPGKIGIVVGDVSGKGLEAATVTSLVKHTVKAFAHHDRSPASVMSKTNEIVCKAASLPTFVTVFFGVLDTETGRLAYCSAGHPPAILRRAGAEVLALDADSPAAGIFPDLEYSERLETLESGDILVAYTDGVIDARQGAQFFGERRLLDAIRGLESIDVSHVPGKLFDDVMTYTGGRLADDVALLAICLA